MSVGKLFLSLSFANLVLTPNIQTTFSFTVHLGSPHLRFYRVAFADSVLKESQVNTPENPTGESRYPAENICKPEYCYVFLFAEIHKSQGNQKGKTSAPAIETALRASCCRAST